MLRIIRTILALICFLAITALFLDFSGTAASQWGWIVRYQVIPALLSANIIAILILAAVTFLFGRVYCSMLCPLGVMQDVISRIRIWLSGKRRRRVGTFRYKPAENRVRIIIFAVFAVLVILGLVNLLAASIASLIEPYSAYGRIVSGIFKPAYVAANNTLAQMDAESGEYSFYFVNNVITPALTAVGGITFIIVAVCAALTGRGYCNRICPVGTLLGFISKHSVFRLTIDTDKCNNCGSCARHCKASCIDPKAHEVDGSRCVVCMDCVGHCRQGALKYRLAIKSMAPKPASKQPVTADKSRRNFLTITGIAAGAAVAGAAEKITDGGLTALKARTVPARAERILPPGAVSAAHLNQHCVGCQLCIQACPSGVIRTSTDAGSFMQPYIEYTSENFCAPECTVCSNICPAGAFHPLDEALKSSTKIGTAYVDLSLCIDASQGIQCGNCARHCPAGAIDMVPVDKDKKDGPKMPVVKENACIGCGACESHCPVGTVASMGVDVPAIHVEGISVQRTV